MNSMDSMIYAINSVGVYGLEPEGSVCKELEAYAWALDSFYDEADKVLSECFVQTAEDIGLEMYEELLGRIRSELSTEKRRELVMALLSVKPNDFTLGGVERFFESLDFECDITEFPQYFEVLIEPSGRAYTESEKDLIIEKAQEFLPCHLTCTVEFRDADWDIYDGLERTFDEWDESGMSWNGLDKFEGE